MEHFIAYKNSRIAYCIYGNGAHIVFCFHGYGLEASSFAILAPFVTKKYTLIAIDLPYHGQTVWQEGLHIRTAEVVSIMYQILMQQGFSANSKVALLGYSLGGRIITKLLVHIPERITSVLLCAPDGLRQNYWQLFATKIKLGNYIFQHFMRHPFWLLQFVKMLRWLRILSAAQIKFVHNLLGWSNERALLYKRWITLRDFTVRPQKLKKIITTNAISIKMVFGMYDGIIPIVIGKRFIRGIEAHSKLQIMECGHQILKEKYAATIASFLFL